MKVSPRQCVNGREHRDIDHPASGKYIHSVAEPSFKGFRIGVPREVCDYIW